MWNCTHFGHPTEEQLRISDIVRSKIYLQSVPFELCKAGAAHIFLAYGTKCIEQNVICGFIRCDAFSLDVTAGFLTLEDCFQ